MAFASSVKKWGLFFLLFLLISSSVGFFWYKYQVQKSQAAFTPVIDAEEYFEEYSTIGIKNVSVLHADGTHFIPNQYVVLRNGVIEQISAAMMDSSITYIDGSGKFLIPGLTDTHVHLKYSKNDLMLYLANGVTSVWEMFGYQAHLDWKEEKAKGAISPELFIATRKLGSEEGWYHWGKKYFGAGLTYTSENDARKGVHNLYSQGYDAIKLGGFINREIYDVVLEEAAALDLKVMGHLPYDVGLEEMFGSGIAQLAHVEEITKNMMEEIGGVGYENTAEFLEYVELHADSISIRLKEDGIAVTTTLFLMESLPKQKFDLENYLSSIELEYVHPILVEGHMNFKGWLPGNNIYENLEIKNDPERRELSEMYWNTYVEAIHLMTRSLQKNGVVLLAGTDANVTGAVPGFSLHDELSSLVQLGLTPAEVMYSATVAPANWSAMNTGAIEIGRKADLILLSENPLENIEHTRSIDMVFTGSYYLDSAHRQQLLEAIKNLNDELRTIDISEWE